MAEEARLGARSTLDVLDADQERLQAEAEIVQALRDEYVAAYDLMRAMGLLTVEHLNLGIETYDPDVNFIRVQGGRPGGYDTSAVDRIRARWERWAGDRRRHPQAARARVARRGPGLDPGAGLLRDRGAARPATGRRRRADADPGHARRPPPGPRRRPRRRARGAGGRAAPILDEESLRDLINAIVREELQGELGERISRNLRKLIRREIAQILEEQRRSLTAEPAAGRGHGARGPCDEA